MSPTVVGLLGVALLAAAVDWHAVATGAVRRRPLTKPAPMVLLIVAAVVGGGPRPEGFTILTRTEVLGVTVDTSGWGLVLGCTLVAVTLSLVGDVLLLPQLDRFVAGLASFLLAHLAYIAAFAALGVDGSVLAVASVGVLALVSPFAWRIVRRVRTSEPPLLGPVVVYIAVISTMAAAAIATRSVLPAAGALVFVASDTQLAWNRFVTPGRALEVGCIVTYHAAQALLVLGLA